MAEVTQAIANQNLQHMYQYFSTANSEHTHWLPLPPFSPKYTFERFLGDYTYNGYEWHLSFSDGIFKELGNRFTLVICQDQHNTPGYRNYSPEHFRFKASIKYKIKQSPWKANTTYDSLILNSAIISFVNKGISDSHLLQFNPKSCERGTDTTKGETNEVLVSFRRDRDMDFSGVLITLNVTKIPDESVDIVLPDGKSLTFPNVNVTPFSTKPPNGTTSYAKYFLAETLSDCKVVAGDKIFPAHRFVLMEISAFFQKMFSNNMAENQNREWRIDDFDPVVVQEFLEFAYTGTCKSLTLTNKDTDADILKELYRMGHKYNVEPLWIQSKFLLKGLVNNENVFSIYHLGFLYGSRTLMDAAKMHFTRFKSQILHNMETFRHFHENYPVEMIFELTK